ncbi:GNAT family N-acetyltransferase [Vibrio vulnificus]|uniref:GNAT family N-acetyltransferase n=1 Tax=Vibrio vulnificus TaxID=672 RepID=UPI0002D79AD4|nr:GNAT family N-acetyltransferase [Vibrio vulnificus]ASM96442.1 acyltransferase [Vibrio vulnificus NBRC 15645 = ATCC 27562]EGQ7984319.1 GNAT family N-acetyltransferase [Vibrio vulnificus]EGQ8002296.1 GNAT family N-acetyltransferase [Vibrio vulnificus]EGQ9994105.1 GNAT family N-acetyltransferase [Vibrio vulnificus]EHU9520841.1 GNAT family N-acetyltransferase [Vibrio vulnificus]
MTHAIHFELLDPIKVPIIKKLYKVHYPGTKVKKDENIVVAMQDKQTIGVVRFRRVEEHQLMTGMLVIPSQREKGIAHCLLKYCAERLLDEKVFCFAYRHLEPFYAQHSFVTISSEQLPNSLKQKFIRYSESGKDLVPMQYQAQIR